MVVSSLLTEAGFESAEKASVETLTEMLQSCECGAFGAGLGPPPPHHHQHHVALASER